MQIPVSLCVRLIVAAEPATAAAAVAATAVATK